MRSTLKDFLVALLALTLIVGASGLSVAAESHGEAAGEVDSALPPQSPLEQVLFPRTPNYLHPPLQPNLQMFLFTLIFFGLFMFVMKKTTWLPLIQALSDRDARVVNAERDAEAARQEVVRLRAESEARLAEVQDRVKAIIAQARSEADAEKRTIVADAEQHAQQVKESALSEIRQAHDSALQNLDQMVDEQVALVTEHVVGRRL